MFRPASPLGPQSMFSCLWRVWRWWETFRFRRFVLMAHGLCCHFEESIGENTVLFCPAFQLKKKESYESNSLIFSGTTRNRTMRSSDCISLNWISAKGTVSRGCSTEKPHHFAGFHGVDFLLRCKDNLLFWKASRCPPILLHLEKESNRRKKDEWQNRIILVVFRWHLSVVGSPSGRSRYFTTEASDTLFRYNSSRFSSPSRQPFDAARRYHAAAYRDGSPKAQ